MADSRRVNRNRKYDTPGLLFRACMYALAGCSKTDCFRKVGVNPDTGFDWLRQGREETGPDILIKFEQVFERCVAHFNAKMVGMVAGAAMSGAPNTWQAAMTLLERRDPGNWGKRDALKIEADKPLIQLNQVVLVDEDARELSRDLLRRIAGPRPDESIGTGVRGELGPGDE